MKSKIALLWALVVVCVLALGSVGAKAAASRKTLSVKLNYSGTEKVDQSHKIYVLLFDANPYTATSLVDSTSDAVPPAPEADVCHILRRESASGKNQTLTFEGLTTSSVYAMAFVDKTGNYDPHGEPPSGSPVGAYGKATGNAEPIALEEGKTTKIVLAFDDSLKIP
jgi:hypothetical protein